MLLSGIFGKYPDEYIGINVRLFFCIVPKQHTETVTQFFLWKWTLSVSVILLSTSFSLFSTFSTLVQVLHQLEQLLFISLYLSFQTFLLSLRLLTMLFSGSCTHDLHSLNVVLRLQSADETIICHINSPFLSAVLLHTDNLMAPFNFPASFFPFSQTFYLVPNRASLKPVPPSHILWRLDIFTLTL